MNQRGKSQFYPKSLTVLVSKRKSSKKKTLCDLIEARGELNQVINAKLEAELAVQPQQAL